MFQRYINLKKDNVNCTLPLSLTFIAVFRISNMAWYIPKFDKISLVSDFIHIKRTRGLAALHFFHVLFSSLHASGICIRMVLERGVICLNNALDIKKNGKCVFGLF